MMPFAAVRDALDRFEADLIVISTHPADALALAAGRTSSAGAKSTFGIPVVHVVSHVREEAKT